MIEKDMLTFLIIFALFMNTLGFLFFALSLKKEPKNKVEDTYDKDYNLTMNDLYQKEEEKDEAGVYYVNPIQEEQGEYTEPKDAPFEYEEEPKSSPFVFKREPEPIYYPDEPEEEIEEEIEEENPYQFKYEPAYEPEPEPVNEFDISEYDKHQFKYEPEYENEEDNELEENNEPEVVEPTEVDYKDEVQKTNKTEDENAPRFDGEYQFKHAYSKEERYKYEYDDYKLYNKKPNDIDMNTEDDEEFDYNIDIDKEHEKYYGVTDEKKEQSKYELYLQNLKKDEEEKTQPVSRRVDRGREMFQQTDILNGVPETPIDREEREEEETIDIKSFEPRKYENQVINEKQEDEFDDAEVDKRIEYLMGKMRDPFQGSNKKGKNPLDEEF